MEAPGIWPRGYESVGEEGDESKEKAFEKRPTLQMRKSHASRWCKLLMRLRTIRSKLHLKLLQNWVHIQGYENKRDSIRHQRVSKSHSINQDLMENNEVIYLTHTLIVLVQRHALMVLVVSILWPRRRSMVRTSGILG